ncbi:putative protein involved in outer membrane biogenesis [Limihaloglobus sulfuriphilus]|uniref:Uncharacterized protein n=1 Tax=Limihaloglobus sulfuriphilus TaxID=1851148 RepID=A0A1Q2MGW6_9BACT|nr:hypothetical protein [Limihaloglobus sulfuriphilus]AQQ71778.1 putative protein involved in outer membrane biogenesis [Limihaloglobus sulfuriphilus]
MDNIENKPKRRKPTPKPKKTSEANDHKPSLVFGIFKLLTVFSILLGLLIYFGVPYAVSTEQFKRFITNRVDSEGGMLRYSELKFSWVKGIDITSVTYYDPKGELSVQAARLKGRVLYLPLFKKEIVLKDVVLDAADVSVTILTPEQNEPAVYQAGGANSPQTVICGQDFKFSLTGLAAKVKNSRFRINTLITTQAITDFKVELLRFTGVNADINIDKPGNPSKLDVTMNIIADEQSYPVNLKSEFLTPSNGIPETLSLQCNIDKLDMSVLQPAATVLQIPVKLSGVVDLNINTKMENKTIRHFTASSNSSEFKVKSEVENIKDIEIESITGDISLRGDEQFLYFDKFYCSTDFGTINLEGKIPQKQFDLKTISNIGNFALNGNLDIDIKKMLDTCMVMERPAGSFTVKSGRLLGSFKMDNLDSGVLTSSELSLNDFSASSNGELVRLSKPVQLVSKVKVDSKYKLETIEEMSLTSDFFEIKSSGPVEAANFTADVDITGINRFVRFATGSDDMTFAGKFNSSGIISRQNGMAKFDGSANIKDFKVQDKIKDISIIEPDIQSAFKFSLPSGTSAGEGCYVEDFRLELTAGMLRLFDMNLNPDSSSHKASFKADLSLKKLFDWAKLIKPELAGYVVSGKLNASGKASVNTNKYAVLLDKSTIEGLSVISEAKTLIQQKNIYADLDAEFDALNKTLKTSRGGVVKLDNLEMNIAALNLGNDGTTQSIDADITADYDLLKLTTDFINLIPENMKALKVAGKDRLDLKLKGSWPAAEPKKIPDSVSGNISFGFDSINYKGIKTGAAKIKAAIAAGVLNVDPLSVPVNEGTVNADIKVDFNKELWPLTIKTPVRLIDNVFISEESARELMQRLTPLIATSSRLSGYVTADLTKFSIPLQSADMNTAEIEGSYRINKIKFSAAPLFDRVLSAFGLDRLTAQINVLPTDFDFNKGRMSYKRMIMDVDNVPFELSGAVDSTKKMDLLLTLPITLNGELVRTNQLQNSQKRVEVPLSGLMNNPDIEVEAVLKQQAANRIDNLMRDALGGSETQKQTGDETNPDTTVEGLIKEGIRSIFD